MGLCRLIGAVSGCNANVHLQCISASVMATMHESSGIQRGAQVLRVLKRGLRRGRGKGLEMPYTYLWIPAILGVFLFHDSFTCF